MNVADGAQEACACEMVGWAHTAYKEDEPLLDEVLEAGRKGSITSQFVRSPSAGRFAASRCRAKARP